MVTSVKEKIELALPLIVERKITLANCKNMLGFGRFSIS